MINPARLIVALVLFCGAACSTHELDVRDAKLGTIVARFYRDDTSALQSIHVKADITDNCGVVYTIDSRTTIQSRSAAGTVHPRSAADLITGARVRVWAPYELESCPAQATATAVELVVDP